MSIARERLTSEESRAAALEAARSLLIDVGPQAVTLKAVAARIGKTHANLLHHFGSAAGLQSALAGSIANRVTAGGVGIGEGARQGGGHPRGGGDGGFRSVGGGGGGGIGKRA